MALTRLQPGNNQYEFFVDNVLRQGPSATPPFSYALAGSSSVTVRVTNACSYETTLSFKPKSVSPGSIILSNNSIQSALAASHTGAFSGLASINYRWESSFDQVTWAPVNAISSASFSNVPIGNQATFYRRVAESTYGTSRCEDYSNVIVIAPQERSVQTNTYYCNGDPLPLLRINETTSTTIISY